MGGFVGAKWGQEANPTRSSPVGLRICEHNKTGDATAMETHLLLDGGSNGSSFVSFIPLPFSRAPKTIERWKGV